MTLSKIWAAFIIISICIATSKFFFTNEHTTIFSKMVVGKQGDTCNTTILDSNQLNKAIISAIATSGVAKQSDLKYTKNNAGMYISYTEQLADGIITTCKNAVEICLGLIGIMALFMGLMSIAERAGGIRLLAKIVGPFFSKLFPELPQQHPAMGHMIMNFSANLLNLDNAATPFGIKAMESLQELNIEKNKASNAQIMFLCLHASGLTLIPVTIIAARASLKANSPTDIFIPCMIATFAATIAAMCMVAIKQKINLLQSIIIAWVGGAMALIGILVWYVSGLSNVEMQHFSGLLSNALILLIISMIVLGALYKKIDIFDAFVQGAKGGFETSIKIIPYVVGILVAISMLRTSGSFELILQALRFLFATFGFDTNFVDGLPTALMKPLSGSGARGMMLDTMKTYGVDSFAGRLSCILQGSSDTTFYVIAVYFGAVGIKNTRYAIGIMLLADLIGVITSIALCYLFFG